ncbi:MAG: hypothetical protein L0H93_00590 [Nocardioides sp.]|nr:hypothetical protein [Nocardioides sp.]
MPNDSANSRSGPPTCTWVEVTDAQGRRRLEARWTVTPVTPHVAVHAA